MKQDTWKTISTGRMLPFILLCLTAVLQMPALAHTSKTEDASPYIVYNSSTKTLKFDYGTVPVASSDEEVQEFSWSPVTSYLWRYSDKTTCVEFTEAFAAYKPTSLQSWFTSFSVLESIKGIEHLNTSEVTDMSYMFSNCRKLKEIDLSHFDTRNVTNIESMFYDCRKLQTLDLSHFDTRNVTNMACLFSFCSSLKEVHISGLNTAKVTDMSHMFAGCEALTTIDLLSFDTSNVTSMMYMFHNCSSLTTLNLSNFNTAKVTDMQDMFYGCEKLTSISFAHFDTSLVKNMSELFRGCSSLTQLDLSHFDTGNVTDMKSMFEGCTSLAQLDLSHFNTSKVENMEAMFYECSSLSQIDLSHYDTSNVTNMNLMFASCTALTDLNVTHFNTSNVEEMQGMFAECTSLATIDLSHFDTSNVYMMACMFSGSSFTHLDLSHFDTSNVNDMESMFYGCSDLVQLDLSSFDTSNVEDMTSMFQDCSSLSSFDLSHFDTRQVEYMDSMFRDCSNVTSLDLRSFDTRNVEDMSSMFEGCTRLTWVDITNFDTSQVPKVDSMFLNCTDLADIFISSRFKKTQEAPEMFRGCPKLPMAGQGYDSSLAHYRSGGTCKTYYLAHGGIRMGLRGDQLTVAATLQFNDSLWFRAIEPIHVAHIGYERGAKDSQKQFEWGTLCLPFALDANTQSTQDTPPYQLYAYDGYTAAADGHTGTITLRGIDHAEAGQPVFFYIPGGTNYILFQQKEADIVTAPIDCQAEAADGLYIRGAFEDGDLTTGHVLAGNVMWDVEKLRATQGIKEVRARYRAHLAALPGHTAPQQLRLPGSGQATGIDATGMADALNEGQAHIYDASGQRRASLQPGLNIVRYANGSTQKIIVK